MSSPSGALVHPALSWPDGTAAAPRLDQVTCFKGLPASGCQSVSLVMVSTDQHEEKWPVRLSCLVCALPVRSHPAYLPCIRKPSERREGKKENERIGVGSESDNVTSKDGCSWGGAGVSFFDNFDCITALPPVWSCLSDVSESGWGVLCLGLVYDGMGFGRE